MWIMLETKRELSRAFPGYLFVVGVLLCGVSYGEVEWLRKTIDGPNSGNEQTACVVADFDKDGIVDFAVTERTQASSVVWYKYNGDGWDKRVVDNSQLKPEAGAEAPALGGSPSHPQEPTASCA